SSARARTSSSPGRRAAWPTAGRPAGAAAPATTGRSSGSPPPARSSGSRSTPATSRATPRGAVPSRASTPARPRGPPTRPAAGARLDGWRLLLGSPLQPHTRHAFDELRRVGPVTHLRLSVFPDGGVARLRAWGEPAVDPIARPAGLARLNALPADDARAALRR